MNAKEFKEYQKVAGELNKVLGLDPPIDLKDRKEIEKKIKEAAELLVPEDVLSEPVQKILIEKFGVTIWKIPEETPEEKPKPTKKPAPVKKDAAPVPDTEKPAKKIEKSKTTKSPTAKLTEYILEFAKAKDDMNITRAVEQTTEWADIAGIKWGRRASDIKAHIKYLQKKEKIGDVEYAGDFVKFK